MYFKHMGLPHHKRMLEAISTQHCVNRYAQFPMIHRQNVAEHVGCATEIMVMVLGDIPGNRLGEHLRLLAMQGIAVHDLAESITGDIPHPVKHAIAAIDIYEHYVCRSLINNNELSMVLEGKEALVVKSVIHLVDMAEFVLCCTQEVLMGNQLIEQVLQDGLNFLMSYQDEIFVYLHVDEIPTINTIMEGANHALKSK